MKAPLKNQKDLTPSLETGYNESNRKTKAFYASLGVIVILFMGNHFWGDTKTVIEQITQLAMTYIAGLSMADSVRYYKYGSKTLSNPETPTDLKDRYADK